MDFTKPPVDAAIQLTLSFDEKTGVLAVGWTARPSVNLGSMLAYHVSAGEARALARALDTYADGAEP
jgi:hypothetical protein